MTLNIKPTNSANQPSSGALNITQANTLNIEQLNVQFDQKKILQDFSLKLNEGDILCLLGPSGCGKTTALKAIAGLLKTQTGKVELFGKVLKKNAFELPPEKRDIGFIFQDYALFPHMTVAQNIGFSLKGQPSQAIEAIIEQTLNLVHLDGMQSRYPHELSGGQQQRTAVARALANRPKLLLMDEPFSNIDSQVKQSLMSELRRLLKSHNITCIFVTHAKQEAFAFADKTALLNNGKLVQMDSSQNLYEKPCEPFVAQFMESGNLLACQQENKNLFKNLFKKKLPENQQDGFLLLRENGFELNATNGESVTVLDSLYIGYRYRNEVKLAEQTLYIESEHELAVHSQVKIQYRHVPEWVTQP
ncbi:MAG: ABC transporter ATP-binding protein [Bermanella sp.]